MIKRLTKVGNSHALVIEKPLMDALGITGETPLQVRVDGHNLIISPVDVGAGSERVDQSLKKMRKRHGRMLKRLAE